VEVDVEKIVFAGGGTGGHLFPALAVADELKRRRAGREICFVGSRRGLETRLVPGAGYPLRTLRLSGIKGMGPLGKLAGAAAAGWAVLRCAAWMIAWRPQLVIGVGGYVLEQNHYPGATNRWLAPRVDMVCVPSDEARHRFGGRGIVTGNPVRREFLDVGPAPMGPQLSLLVFGGSRGAHSINVAMGRALRELARLDPVPRVVHQTGTDDEAELREAARGYPDGSYEVRPFLDDMPARFAAADLIVSRAGATTMAELAAAGRPAILVPYPYATDDHQRHNAEAVERAGAAIVVLDKELEGNTLFDRIRELTADRARLARMATAARGLAHPDAAERIADAAEALLANGGQRVS
jgi:UDP-N-acetylglucosamine--N-acetylmuramyl-(pentapeptide) pyrophosphoryl-undecaprenol N-acetylglucosamine transferase